MPEADVVELDNGGVGTPNFQEPEGLTLDDVDDNFEPIAQTEDTPSATAEEVVESPWYDEYLDKTIPVKIGDKESDVTVEELRKGYLRQQDYTKKTTEVATVRKAAEWGQAMQAQLRADPVGTLSQLAAALGVGFNPKADPDLGEEVFDSEDAKYAQLRAEFESRLDAHEESIKITEYQRELNGLQAKYGEDFVMEEVVSYVQEALNDGYDIPFEQAFLTIQGQKALAEKQRVAKKAAAETARRKSAATQVTQRVAPANPASRILSHGDTDKVMSLRDIFNLELEGVE